MAMDDSCNNTNSNNNNTTLDDSHGGRTIAIAMDASAHSFHALHWALNSLLSEPHPCDRLLLVHARVPATSKMALGGPGYLLTTELIISIQKLQDREIQRFMNKALELCREKQIVAETFVSWGDPRDVLCKLAKTIKPDVLVVGSHGYGFIRRFLMGSVSDYCARHAKCPVVVVKNPSSGIRKIRVHDMPNLAPIQAS